jgi:hypothetical protein
MARGQIFKEEISKKILEAFPGSFKYDGGKEIRICGTEDGEPIQIKVTLTCAKINVEPDGDIAIPGALNNEINFGQTNEKVTEQTAVKITQEEKDNIKKILSALDL